MDNDDVMLVCAPVALGTPVAGTTYGHYCARCRTEVMMAPSSQKFIAAHPEAVIVCFPCARKETDPTAIHTPVPGALQELAAHMLKQSRN